MRTSHTKKGFTLVEMIVAVAIFAMVMVVAIGALLTVVDANRKAQTLKSVVNNLNFALETIGRTVRTGTSYDCGQIGSVENCPSPPSTRFNFRSAEGETVSYRFCSSNADTLHCGDSQVLTSSTKPEGIGWIERQVDGGAWISMTANEVDIERMSFYVRGVGSEYDGASEQPKVTMIISGFAGDPDVVDTEFHVQTTMTQRVLDF